MNANAQGERIVLPVLCLLIATPSLIYLAARMTVPGDGALIDFQKAPAQADGLFIAELIDPAVDLRADDLLLAMDDVTVEQWLGPSRSQAASLEPGSALEYTVLRGEQPFVVRVELEQGRLLDQLTADWPSYLFLTYLLAVAVFIYARRSSLPAAQTLLLASSLIFASGSIFFSGLQASDVVRGWPIWVFLWGSLGVYGLSMGAILHFSLTFPTVHPTLRRYPRSVVLIYAALWVPFAAALGLQWTSLSSASAKLVVALRAAGLFTAISAPLGLAILLVGYRRRFDARQRRQTRWLLWSGSVVVVPWIGLSVIPPLLGATSIVPRFAMSLLWLVLPTSFAVAIVRESLFDIDRIINRTLVYGSLTLVLVLIYLGVVVALQQGFEAVTGQQSPLAIVLSTLLIAAAFHPLRRRIQGTIDRRFFRRRYDAARELDQLSRELARRVELTELSNAMIGMVQDSLEPVHLSLWLRTGEPRQ